LTNFVEQKKIICPASIESNQSDSGLIFKHLQPKLPD